MSRGLNKLTSRTVETAKEPGRYSDGGNLYLVVSPSGAKKWTLLFDFEGKRREMGLGAVRDVSLASARDKASAARKQLDGDINPLDAKSEKEAVPTFGDFADAYFKTMRVQWRNEKHVAQWSMTLKEYAKPIRALPVDKIGTENILSVLKPIWQRIPETAERVRGRMEAVLSAAKAKGHRTGENPASWRGHLDQLLPKRQRLTRGHHAALAYADLPSFMVELREREAMAALALEFTILTACRTGEVIGACWSEIDKAKSTWTIPASRMKAGREHRVPLSPRALAILEAVKPLATEIANPVFPSTKGKPLSNMAMNALLRRMNRRDITVHGFRSTFRDWASETTGFPQDVCEMALAHTISNKVEAAYRRGDLFDKRRALMDAWASYCEPKAGNVLSMRREA